MNAAITGFVMKQFSRFAGDFLRPVTSARFFDEYWETAPLHIGRSDEQYFSDLLSLADIENALSCQEFSFPTVQLTQAGESVPVSEYTGQDGRIVVPRLLQRHQQGATVVMSGAQKYLPRLGQFARHVQSDLQLRTQANVYLSPAGKQGFNAHFDSHDVFILQVGGKKTFRFYDGGTDLPMAQNAFDPDHCEIGSLQEEIQLDAGDTMYIPRGMIHDAVADNNEPSLHITLGVYAITVGTVLQEILQLALEQDLRYRKSIDYNVWQQGSADTDSLKTRMQQIMSAAFSEDRLSEAIARLRDDLALDTTPDCRGWLSSCHEQEINTDTVLELLPNQVISKDTNPGGVVLRVAARVIQFDPIMMAAIDQLFQQGQVAVGELQDLDSDQQIALASRLYQERLVRTIPSSV